VTALCVNGGSSSLKVALYAIDERERRLADGQAKRIGSAEARLEWANKTKEALKEGADHAAAMRRFGELLAQASLPRPDVIAHRIVHGGETFDTPCVLGRDTATKLRALIPLAPLHLPSGIALVEACAEIWPDTPQVLCFDTAFHRRMPAVAQRLPLPRKLAQQGVRRYGFHGISYEYVLSELGDDARGRVILAHLGAGASLAAVLDGRPVDTTMGFTPAGGLMMATRCGDIDPGVLVHLMREHSYGADALDALTNEESGLLGVSGRSGDMAELLAAAPEDQAAREAVESFCYIARKHIGAMAAALGGLDLLVFTAGIGERAHEVRAEVCEGLGHLGIELDPERNALHAETISAPGARCRVKIVPTNEELQMARAAAKLVCAR
jgi:acetate kinase